MSNVFDITERYLKLLQELEELDGELTPELESQLIGIKDEIEERLTAYRFFIKYKESDIALLKGVIEEYNAKVKYAENAIDRVKKIVAMILENFGDINKSGNKTYKTTTFTVWNQPSRSVTLTDSFTDFKAHPFNEKYGQYAVNLLVPTVEHKKFIESLNATLLKKADEFVPNKTAIKEALDNKVELSGATMTIKDSIRFK